MGNSEICLSRQKNKIERQNSNSPRQKQSIIPRSTKRLSVKNNQNTKNTFLYNIDSDGLIQLTLMLQKQSQYRMKQQKQSIDIYSPTLTRKIIQLQEMLEKIDQVNSDSNLKDFYQQYYILRTILLLNQSNINKAISCIKEDIQFKYNICNLYSEIDSQLLKESIYFVAQDFNQFQCIGVRINKFKGNLKIHTIQKYVCFFIDVLWYEVAKTNKLDNKLNILLDFDQNDLNNRFLQFFIDLSLQHYFLLISKIYVINFNLESISSETSTLLQTPIVNHFTYVFNIDYKQYLPKYLKKSTLIEYYGGKKEKYPSVPMSIEEARTIVL